MTDERAAVELNIPTGDFDYHEWCRKALPEWWALYGSTYGSGCSAVRVDRSQIGFRPVDFSQAALVEIVALRAENTELSARVSELTRLLAEAEERVNNLRGGYHDIMSAEYLCSDTFAWACADVEDIGGDCEEWRELAELIERFGSIAVTAYIAIKRGHDPVTGAQNDDRFIRAKAELLDRLSRSEETAEFSGLYDHVQLRALQSGEGKEPSR